MQIVIDIDDNLYTRLFDNGKINVIDMRRACVAIRKGTPLPKGHGRIGDVDQMEYLKALHDAKFGKIKFSEAINKIKNSIPTIVEADKAEREGGI